MCPRTERAMTPLRERNSEDEDIAHTTFLLYINLNDVFTVLGKTGNTTEVVYSGVQNI